MCVSAYDVESESPGKRSEDRGDETGKRALLGWPCWVPPVCHHLFRIVDFILRGFGMTMMAKSHNTWLAGGRGKIISWLLPTVGQSLFHGALGFPQALQVIGGPAASLTLTSTAEKARVGRVHLDLFIPEVVFM